MHKILLADDQEELRLLLEATLEDGGYELLEARTGPEALTIARTQAPALILLDWMMPGMSGLEVVQALRAAPETRAIPVILLTARNQLEDRQRGLDAGATLYIAKPFSPLQLAEHVKSLLELVNTVP